MKFLTIVVACQQIVKFVINRVKFQKLEIGDFSTSRMGISDVMIKQRPQLDSTHWKNLGCLLTNILTIVVTWQQMVKFVSKILKIEILRYFCFQSCNQRGYGRTEAMAGFSGSKRSRIQFERVLIVRLAMFYRGKKGCLMLELVYHHEGLFQSSDAIMISTRWLW